MRRRPHSHPRLPRDPSCWLCLSTAFAPAGLWPASDAALWHPLPTWLVRLRVPSEEAFLLPVGFSPPPRPLPAGVTCPQTHQDTWHPLHWPPRSQGASGHPTPGANLPAPWCSEGRVHRCSPVCRNGAQCGQTLCFLITGPKPSHLKHEIWFLKLRQNVRILKPPWGPNKAHLQAGFPQCLQRAACTAPLSQAAGRVSPAQWGGGRFWRGWGSGAGDTSFVPEA